MKGLPLTPRVDLVVVGVLIRHVRVPRRVLVPVLVNLDQVAKVVGVPELRGRPVPGVGVPLAAVLAGPAQHLHAAVVDGEVARPVVPRAALAPQPPDQLEVAAMGGNLELVQWLRAGGCPWSAWTCHWAVDQGRVEVLRWARENGCPWEAEDRDRAAEELGYAYDFGNLSG